MDRLERRVETCAECRNRKRFQEVVTGARLKQPLDARRGGVRRGDHKGNGYGFAPRVERLEQFPLVDTAQVCVEQQEVDAARFDQTQDLSSVASLKAVGYRQAGYAYGPRNQSAHGGRTVGNQDASGHGKAICW